MTTTFEVRVEGELTGPTLHRLGCAHCVAEEQLVVRIEATPSDLQRLLKECADHGMTIDSVVRVEAS
jgi:hypothetical protein